LNAFAARRATTVPTANSGGSQHLGVADLFRKTLAAFPQQFL
jgi:hypothetical protein